MTPSTAPQSSYSATNSVQSALADLQPALRSTLSSLNIHLDYELARYRYAKQGDEPVGVMPPQFQPQRRGLSLMNVPAPKPSPPTQTAVTPPPLPPNPRLQHSTFDPTSSAQSEVAALRSAIVQRQASPQEAYLASSEALLQNFEAGNPPSRSRAQAAPPAKSGGVALNTPLGLGAFILLLVASAGLGFILVNPYAAANLFEGTPLARLLPNEDAASESSTAAADSENAEVGQATADFDGPPLTSLSPDLSQREFSNLDLNSLSNLPSSSTAPIVGEAADAANDDANVTDREPSDRRIGQATVTPSSQGVPNSASPAPTRPPTVDRVPAETTPAPQPAVIAPAPAAPAPVPTQPSAPASGDLSPAPTAPAEPTSREPVSSYYVVTDYTGDPSLDAARTAIEDAYVRNFDTGARIQLGAFNTEAGAAALAEELKNQGIEAQIYEP